MLSSRCVSSRKRATSIRVRLDPRRIEGVYDFFRKDVEVVSDLDFSTPVQVPSGRGAASAGLRRVRRATGSPARPMIISSPASTRRSSFERCVLASCTLTTLTCRRPDWLRLAYNRIRDRFRSEREGPGWNRPQIFRISTACERWSDSSPFARLASAASSARVHRPLG